MKWFGPAKTASVALAVLLAASCSPKAGDALVSETPAPLVEPAAAPAAPAPSIEGIPAGDYKLDPEHSTLFFRINHLGFSNFTLWYTKFSADLKLDPANPSAASLSATIDPASLMVPAPTDEFLDHLKSADYLDTKAFPAITFKSTAIKLTGPNTADVTGDLTLHGITKPVTLQMTYNGGYAGHVYDPLARIGFSARGTFNRSDFGIGAGIPQPGSTMGASDQIEVILESEWKGPAWKDAPPAAPAQN